MVRVDRAKKNYLEGLWAYWPFEEPEGSSVIYDQSGNELDLNPTNLTKAKGILGDAYYFNGYSYATLPSDKASVPSDYISVCAWAYSPEYPNHNMHIISKRYEYSVFTPFRALRVVTYSFGIRMGEMDLIFFVSGAYKSTAYAQTDAIYGKWFHVCGTYDGNYVRIYINGKLKDEVEYSGRLYQEVYPIEIGQFSSTDRWVGYIDEIMIFTRALSDEEVRKLYQMYKRERQKIKVKVI